MTRTGTGRWRTMLLEKRTRVLIRFDMISSAYEAIFATIGGRAGRGLHVFVNLLSGNCLMPDSPEKLAALYHARYHRTQSRRKKKMGRCCLYSFSALLFGFVISALAQQRTAVPAPPDAKPMSI